MSEWKGPWKCEKCGLDYLNITNNILHGKCQLHCQGRLLPYERRAADEWVRELVGALEMVAVPLEKIRMSMKWELTEVSKEEVIDAVCVIRAALRKYGVDDSSTPGLTTS